MLKSSDLEEMTQMVKICGLQIVESPNLTETEKILRSWTERLFSWPWRPWVRYRYMQFPAKYVYVTNSGLAICHPAVADVLRRMIREQ